MFVSNQLEPLFFFYFQNFDLVAAMVVMMQKPGGPKEAKAKALQIKNIIYQLLMFLHSF